MIIKGIYFILCWTLIISQGTETAEPDCSDDDLRIRGLVHGGPGEAVVIGVDDYKQYFNTFFMSCRPDVVNLKFFDNNGTEIKNNARNEIGFDDEEREASLTIEDMTVYDGGRYSLKANLKNDTNITSEKSWDIQVYANPITSLERPKDKMYYVCNVTGFPTPHVELNFTPRDTNVSESVNKDIFEKQQLPHPHEWFVSYHLNVTETRKWNSDGTLTCIGKNELKTDTVQLQIGMPPNVTMKINHTVEYGIILIVKSNSEPTLSKCVIYDETGNNRSVDMIKKGNGIKENIYQANFESKEFSLHNNSTILCFVENQFEVQSEEKEIDPSTFFVCIDKADHYVEGNPLKLVCYAPGSSEDSFTWQKNGLNITSDQNYTIMNEVDRSVLTKLNATKTDSGNYTCILQSETKILRPVTTIIVIEALTNSDLIIGITIAILIVIIVVLAFIFYIFKKNKEDPYNSLFSMNNRERKLQAAGLLSSYGKFQYPKGVWPYSETKVEDRVRSFLEMNDIRKTIAKINLAATTGRHLNIVNVLGVCTDFIESGELYYLKEKCLYGDLLTYIKKYKALFELAANNPIYRSEETLPIRHYKSLSINNPLYGHFSTHDWLTVWAFQVARGMNFLQTNKIFYKSTENILLTEDGIVKITEFSHEKHMALYKPVNNPDTLKGSDLRSYGVFVWRLFSLADEFNSQIQTFYVNSTTAHDEHVLTREHHEPPLHASKTIFNNIILPCWQEVPEDDQKFLKIENLLYDMMLAEVTKYYKGLDQNNIDYNNQSLESRDIMKAEWEQIMRLK